MVRFRIGYLCVGALALALAVGCHKKKDGKNGAAGSSCTVMDNGNGTVTITCEDGTTATVNDGRNGTNGTNGTDGTNGTNGIISTKGM